MRAAVLKEVLPAVLPVVLPAVLPVVPPVVPLAVLLVVLPAVLHAVVPMVVLPVGDAPQRRCSEVIRGALRGTCEARENAARASRGASPASPPSDGDCERSVPRSLSWEDCGHYATALLQRL